MCVTLCVQWKCQCLKYGNVFERVTWRPNYTVHCVRLSRTCAASIIEKPMSSPSNNGLLWACIYSKEPSILSASGLLSFPCERRGMSDVRRGIYVASFLRLNINPASSNIYDNILRCRSNGDVAKLYVLYLGALGINLWKYTHYKR